MNKRLKLGPRMRSIETRKHARSTKIISYELVVTHADPDKIQHLRRILAVLDPMFRIKASEVQYDGLTETRYPLVAEAKPKRECSE